MAWVRFDPGFTQHRKRIEAGFTSNWVWISSVDYCVLHMTDGFLPDAAVPGLMVGLPNRTRGAVLKALLDTNSWERRPDGYLVHGFDEHQDSREDVERVRAAGRQRARAWRDRQANNAERTPLPNVERTPLVTQPPVSTVSEHLRNKGSTAGGLNVEHGPNGGGEPVPPEVTITADEERGLPLIAKARGITVAQCRSELMTAKLREVEQRAKERKA